MTREQQRLEEARNPATPWKKWGPYLSERQWGTVREDYSDTGDAWDYFSHDQARSRAYRWGEDGLAGISDDRQRLCLALALWNGQDPILKERLFGLTNSEGNHGEDVKEYYFYLDASPTHSYLKYLYKYPQAAYPYDQLVATNHERGRSDLEYELLHTGVFVKDGFHDFLIHGQLDAVNPEQTGTKAAAHYQLSVPAGACETVRLRLTTVAPDAQAAAYGGGAFGAHFDEVMQARRREADEFYATVIPGALTADAAAVMRQALAGMIWSKQYFMAIASATIHAGGNTGMWDEEDGFFYDVLQLPDGTARRLKVRSMVGLLPLCAVTVFEGEFRQNFPDQVQRMKGFLAARPELVDFIHDPEQVGHAGRRLAAILDESKLRRVLAIMLDENEFLSPYGLRSLSRHHADHPYHVSVGEADYGVSYLPGESDSGMFGGNSNWRGPIWMPVNALVIRALFQYYAYYGDEFTVECPSGSGQLMNLYQVAEEISRRLTGIFLKDEDGRRPVNGDEPKFQHDAHWQDCIQFYEYFHGDNGAGLGASHQTGWTGAVARIMHLFATTPAEQVLELGKAAAFTELVREAPSQPSAVPAP